MAETLTALPVAPAALVNAPQQPISMPPGFALPSIDPIELLVEPVAEKLRRFRLRVSEAHKLVPEFFELQQVNTEKVAAANRLHRLMAPAAEGGFSLMPEASQCVEAQRLLNRLTAEARRLSDLRDIRTAQWHAAGAALPNVESWVRSKPANCAIGVFEIEAPKLLKNETVLAAIARLREQGEAVKAELSRIANARLPSKHVKARVRQEIEAAAKSGEPVISEIFAHNKSIIWPQRTIRSTVIGADQRPLIGDATVPDIHATLLWLFKDAVISAMDKLVDAQKNDASALDLEAKQTATAAAQASLLEIERQEAALVWRGQSEGQPCEHRADCAPMAILCCELTVLPMAAALPDTSIGHAWDTTGGRRR